MFQPIVPSSGLVGWRFLQRTYDSQTENFNQSNLLQRDTEYFRGNIASITNAEDLVADRRLLRVALGAFGLDDDLGNKFFIKKMLEEGTIADDALSNRFTDTRYRDMVKAFGFGPAEVTRTGISLFTDEIVESYQTKQFEIAIGDQDPSFRIALYAQNELSEIAGDDGSVNQKWFTIMGQPALRQLFEGALGLPNSFGQIDIDKQREIFQERAESIFGSGDPAQFKTPEAVDKLITQYLIRSQIDAISTASPSSIALTLLQS
ncbi:MAG: hypothetical protein ACI84R_000772 [Candidatus Azotimanducaceae bacterium]